MKIMLTLGSLFDGIGGWQLAAVHAGVKPIWSSEIEKFPMEVTRKWFPDTIQLGDITKLNGADIPPVDIICAGSPCQDLSVAGKRAGLEGERSGLFRKAVDIVREMRRATNGNFPRYFVWENVPGAFSSNKGADFRVVLEEIGQTSIPMPESGRWSAAGMVECQECEIAWRVLDAQFWGVPQRRKRIFLVADFAKSDRCAGKILFVEQGLPRDNSESEGKRESSSGEAESSAREASERTTYNVRFTSSGTKVARGHCYESDRATCLDTGGGNPDSNHGGVACIEKTVGALCADDHKGINNQYVDQGKCVVSEYWKDNQPQTCDTLTSRNAGGGQRMPDKDHFNGVICTEVYHCQSMNDVCMTLKQRDYKDPPVICKG